jgi:hypothetical protein
MLKTFASESVRTWKSFPELAKVHPFAIYTHAIELASRLYDHRSETGHAFNCREPHPPATLRERATRHLQATLRAQIVA